MANKIIPKRSSVSGKVPATTDLDVGEIAVNLTDRKIYTKDSGGTVVQLGGGAGSGDVVGPNSSTDNAIARFDLATGKLIQNSSATIDDSGNLTATTVNSSGTGADKMAVGTTAQRPATPQTGHFRLNSTLGRPEWWDSVTSIWVPFSDQPSYSVDYLVVSGGGAGGGDGSGNVMAAGGGGAGGLLTGTASLSPGTAYSILVGAGGSGTTAKGTDGGNSSIQTVRNSIGGGAGGGSLSLAANSGGSGGGGCANAVTAYAAGSGTTGQGFAGAVGAQASQGGAGGGGGGAGSAGTAGSNGYGGAGGSAVTNDYTGSAVTYCGGGGGGGQWGGGAAGNGGGNGASGLASGNPAAANRGGGGGGGASTNGGAAAGGNGGSGIVVIRYAGAQRGTGGTVTSAGGYTIHTFTTSGTYTA